MKNNKLSKFISKAIKIHYEKYDYSLVDYKDMATKILIICPMHGEFSQRPSHHIYRKHGCPQCSITKKLTQEEFITRAQEIHSNKYDYSLVKYINARSKIKIICPIHGIFEQISGSHTDQKTGCSKCSKKYNYSTQEFIDESKLIHGNKYCYSLVNYINNYTKIKITCPIHGTFSQIPTNHLSGKGCEICGESKGENLIRLYLKKMKISFQSQYKFSDCKHKKVLPFDFFIPQFNTCIEYNGKQHYEPIEWFGGIDGFHTQQIRDEIKKNYCKNNNLNLLILKYDDDINEILFSHFKNYLH